MVKPATLPNWLLTLFLATVFIVVFAFLALAKYARKETVVGMLQPSAGALRVTVPKSGMISQVHVHEGDLVAAGAPILTLGSDATLEGGAKLGALREQVSDDQKAALAEEARAHRASILQQRESLSLQMAAAKVRQTRLKGDLELQEKRIELNEASLEAARPLNSRGFLSDIQLRQREEVVLQARQAKSAIERDLEETGSSAAELRAMDLKLVADAQEAAAQLNHADAELREKRASYSADRALVIVAAKAGRVAALQAKAGLSVAAGSSVGIILPEGAILQAELWVPSKAAGFVRAGDEVRLMFDAFPYQRFGPAHGRVIAVANAPTNPTDLPVPIETTEGLYRVTVAIDRQAMHAYGRSWALAPGARLSADLVLESRSFLEWLLEPIYAIKQRNSL